MFKRKRGTSPSSEVGGAKLRKTTANTTNHLETLRVFAQAKITETSIKNTLKTINRLSTEIELGETSIKNVRNLLSQHSMEATDYFTTNNLVIKQLLEIHVVFSNWTKQPINIGSKSFRNLESVLEIEDAYWIIEKLKNLIFLKSCTFNEYVKMFFFKNIKVMTKFHS